MSIALQLDYYHGEEANQYNFYRIPKALFTDEHFKAMSAEAKILYGLMLDRMGCPPATAGWTRTGACTSISRWRTRLT